MSEIKYSDPTYFTDNHALSMTLRDYFAAKAMQGIIPNYWQMVMDSTYEDWPTAIPDMADEAYSMADAMLKAREK